jgi:galactonate dehydratase
MQITDVKTARLSGGSAVVRIDTDEGISGVGEAVVETAPDAALSVVDLIAETYLIGRDPGPIERHRRQMQDAFWYHIGAVISSAIGGIEQTLWDIKGKHLGVPVYELLGGPVRDRVRTCKYLTGETTEELVAHALDWVDQGFDAVKVPPVPEHPYPRCVSEVKETVGAVREAVGPDVDLLVDPASRWKLPEAKHVLEAIEEFDPLFAEDFVSSYKEIYVEEVEKLADSSRVSIALGAQLYRLSQFEEIIHHNAAAVLQPNVSHAGGILELVKIAAAAEHRNIRLAPHNPLGPVATAASVQVDLTIPNFLIQEVSGTEWYGGWELAEYVDGEAIEIEDGYIQAPEQPGLGVTVDDAVFEDQPAVTEASPFFDREEWGDDFHIPEW